MNGAWQDYFDEIDMSSRLTSLEYRHFAGNAVRHYKLTTPRNNPEETGVRIYEQVIRNGQLEWRAVTTQMVMPALVAMTVDEFNVEQIQILQAVPCEFRSALAAKAWDDGHSAGFEEVNSHLKELVSIFEEPIQKYTDRLAKMAQK